MKMAHEVQLAYDKYLESPEETDVCVWVDRDGDKQMWKTSCKIDMWVLDHEDPLECGYNFCPMCGKKIKVKS
jgi:hypothetical protein